MRGPLATKEKKKERAKTVEQITLERGILGEGAAVINEDAEMLELLNSVCSSP